MTAPHLVGSFLGIGDSPTVSSITTLTEQRIRVTFSEQMTGTIGNTSYYTITAATGSIALSVTTASAQNTVNPTFVDLYFNNEMTNGVNNYTLVVSSSVVDLDDGLSLATSSIAYNGFGTPPYIENVSIPLSTNVSGNITFNARDALSNILTGTINVWIITGSNGSARQAIATGSFLSPFSGSSSSVSSSGVNNFLVTINLSGSGWTFPVSFSASYQDASFNNFTSSLFASCDDVLVTTPRILEIPSIETLVLHWSFDNVTGSGDSSDGVSTTADAKFYVADIASGSLALTSSHYWFGPIRYRLYPGQGDFYLPFDTGSIKREYVPAAKQLPPEVLNSADLVDVLSENELQFTRSSRPVKHFYAVEKSPYAILSDEIIKLFGTIVDFNNLIGEPVNRYRQNYKDLEKLRQLYFRRINNSTIDFEKFVDYFKWFDSSISTILQQLIPGSANFSDGIRTVVESHVLERNKYFNKFPLIKSRHTKNDIEGGTHGINFLTYKWDVGSAPVPLTQSSNTNWWKQRAERYSTVIRTGRADVDAGRGAILSSSVTALSRSFTTPLNILSERQYSVPRLTSSAPTASIPLIQPFASTDALLNYNKAYMPYYREPKVVRITNIKDSLASASFSSSVSGVSATLGNYTYDYDIVQTSGRSRNNKFLVRTAGTATINLDSPILAKQLLSASPLSGASNFSLFNRNISGSGKNKYIFAELFSSPGDWRTMSRGHLDQLAEEYSVYNDLNYRNLDVRNAFNVSESKGALQFGLMPDTGTNVGNEHKTNRNTSKIITFSSSILVTASVFDTNFVTHPIPQSDLQYRWVTASVVTSSNTMINYTSDFVNAQSVASATYEKPFRKLLPPSISYVTASSNTGSTISRLFVDFAGLNTLIYDPVTSSLNILSASNNVYTNSSFDSIKTFNVLNALLLHRNGPYEFPLFKQYRNTLHPIVRFHRLNNILSIIDKPSSYVFEGAADRISYKSKRADTFVNYIEPVISVKFKPLIHTFNVTGSSLPVSLRHSYSNNLAMFSNALINNSLGLYRCNVEQMYDRIKDLYIRTNLSKLENPIQDFVNLYYSEVIYPKESNTGLGKIRGRTSYAETNDTGSNGFCRSIYNRRTFWRDSETNRLRTFTGSVPLSSMNTPTFIGRSLWPLGRIFNAPSASSGNNPFGLSAADASGWLDADQNELRGNGELNGIGPREIIAWNYRYAGSGTLHPFANAQLIPTSSQTYVHYWSTRGDNIVNPVYLLEYPPGWYADVYSGKKPWFDSYDAYSADIRSIGKEYSIMPEFRISDHMSYYIDDNGGNFRTRNDNVLLNNGAFITSSATSSNFKSGFSEDFFKTYAHSDFMKYFDIITKDHNINNAGVTNVTLKCKGIKKLLPYNGFYPVTRCLQLGSLLSQSIAPNIGGIDWKNGAPKSSSVGLAPNYSGSLAVQSLLQPFFAPGIIYNTVKSGIAVDWPAFTGSSINFDDGTVLEIEDRANYRIPFEALVDFASYIPISQSNGSGRVLFTPDPTIGSSINLAGSGSFLNTFFDWNGQKSPLFEMAAHNFLAESTNFFLKNSSFTTYVSKPSYTFAGQFNSGTAYFMDVDLFKTNDLVMFEGYWSVNGPNKTNDESPSGHCGSDIPTGTLTTTGHWFGPPSRFINPTPVLTRVGFDPGSAPYQPPYAYGRATARIKYISDGTETDSNALSKILNNSTISYFSTDRENFFKSSAIGGNNNLHTPAFSGSMQLSSSINLLGRGFLKKVEFVNTNLEDNKFVPQTVLDLENQTHNVWTISPKYECPVLNFNEQLTVPCVTASDTTTQPRPLGRMPRGMWSGYGKIPTGSAGIYLSLKESFANLSTGSIGPQLTGSLIKVCGFEAGSKRIGELADYSEISECVVAIPFVDVPVQNNSEYANTINILGKNFFSITTGLFNKQKNRKAAGQAIVQSDELLSNFSGSLINKTSITNLIDKMEKYNFPPEFDFIKYEDIQPFVMYVFEFKHVLDKQDLSDIWQGLMPKIAMTAELDESTLTHDMLPWEFFESKKFPSNVRWMVFKVKKKAATNYFEKTADYRDDARFKFNFKVGVKKPDYSYNWPYDFCSLVELGKIESEIKISNNFSNNIQLSVGVPPTVRTNIFGESV